MDNLIYLILALLALPCCTWAFSSCCEWRLLSSCNVQASNCLSFSCGAQAPGACHSVVLACRLNSCNRLNNSWSIRKLIILMCSSIIYLPLINMLVIQLKTAIKFRMFQCVSLCSPHAKQSFVIYKFIKT